MKVSAFVPDLMDRSKLARIGGDDVAVEVVGSAAALDGEADVVVVDLGRPAALDAVQALRAAGSTARIVGFGSHVERDVLAAARTAGCDRVLARSAFFADVAAAVRGGGVISRRRFLAAAAPTALAACTGEETDDAGPENPPEPATRS